MPRTRSIAWSQVKLGILGVVALLLAAVTVAAVGGEAGFFWQLYPIKMQFRDVQGLKSGAVVRLSGKDVGRVESVEFAGEVIEVDVSGIQGRAGRSSRTGPSATVGALSLLGESFVTVKAAPGGTPVPEWGYVRTTEAGSMATCRDRYRRVSLRPSSSSPICAVEAGRSASS